MPDQIPLNLSRQPDYSLETFVVGSSNQAAFASLKAWRNWPSPILFLGGPEGSGKTHLASAWSQNVGAIFLNSPQYLDDLNTDEEQCMVIDNADHASEDALFTVMNLALNGRIAGLLIVAREHPRNWSIELPDLRSRLVNTPSTFLEEADDDILEPIIRKLFEDRGRMVKVDVAQYLIMNYSRSIEAIKALIEDLDFAAGQAKKDITRPFVSAYLKSR